MFWNMRNMWNMQKLTRNFCANASEEVKINVQTNEEIVEHWNQIKDWYSSTMTEVTAGLFLNNLHLLRLKTARKILEVGCGTGNAIPYILQETDESVEIHASDLTKSMLDIARAAGYPRTSFYQANNESLPFSDGVFDRYIANLSLMIVVSPENMLKEAFRVVQPGGICAFSVWGDKKTCDIINLQFDVIKELELPFEKPERPLYHLNDRENLVGMIKQTGFRKVFCFESKSRLGCFDSEETRKYFESSPPLQPFKGTEDFDRVMDRILEKCNTMLENGQLLTFSGLIAIAIK